MTLISVILGAVGGFSIFYYFVMAICYGGFEIAFSKFWIALGIICILLSYIIKKIHLTGFRINKNVVIVIAAMVFVITGIFAIIEGRIILAGSRKAVKNADYLIVLGAQVRGDVPSQSLQYRIDGANEYLKQNENTIVIASGGKGEGEDISEAEAISKNLIADGISESKIVLEDNSRNTVENLKFSKDIITDENAKVVIVTNGFHMFRAESIAKKLGYKNVSGYSVGTNPIIAANFYVREFFAVVKDKVIGNI